ncbi:MULTISPECIES: metal ABC transporter ATP-binding protein [Vibrio]|uniref:Putative manganese ABC transporter ATP-binding protein n=1 Tax=Vibrio halioticoli NBRC 102217 TaxID=1219072 RepID=V5F248_9VIBR|nr:MULTISPECIES: ABC transporter ATP-binding protein [Vibrio]MPW36364.1 ATP-binding cassette domain-containing protein [Vibrio sp. B1Z05]GAD89199.1 putative manganese ABC transporter ATP-binding protein [Vibrio halioticoli NBRC 102217]
MGDLSSMIHFNDLVIGYQNKAVCHSISGQVKLGSLSAIVGPNGVGKSTLLKTLCGLIPAISGSTSLENIDKKGIAWLPQKSNIDQDFPINVFEVVSMGCWPRKSIFRRLSKKDMQNVDWALEQVGITELKKTSINRLSGGQFQRMLFARLLVQDAPIMLMDEPFAGIDEDTQMLILNLILELHRKGKTIVAVLHDISMVESYFTDIIRLSNGQAIFEQNNVNQVTD